MKTRTGWILIVLLTTTLSARPLLAARDDDGRIVSSAKQSYVYKTCLKHDDITIEANDGVVKLTGEVAGPSHKEMVQDVVEGLPGVRSVDNQLVVKPEDEHSDGSIRLKVKTTLLFHRSVSGIKTDVAVKDGVVTLTGTASSEAQKELTTEYATDIEGVKQVKNELKVTREPPPRSLGQVIDDAPTAQVKAALLTHHSTSALKTKVSTRNGVVTLTGAAKNQTEKDLVTKITNDIKGVKSVVNDMEVKA
jgi:hyperosmotically inducible periplasmic protein